MEQLNAAEPMLCQYEMRLLINEINVISSLVEYEDVELLRKAYREKFQLLEIKQVER